MPTEHKRIVVLGSTGSIGTQTLDVVRAHPDRFKILGLACGANCDLLIEQIREFGVPLACIADTDDPRDDWPAGCQRLSHPEGLVELAAHPDADMVVVATVGAAGFRPTEAALRAGTAVALASKELLVAAGPVFRSLADENGADIRPIDSEHSALWQCLQGEELASVRKFILTASGGPFRDATPDQIRRATAREALQHPNWSMGRKITTDSASLINKGLEVIEAHWLFGLAYDQLEVIIHPESIVHSLVEFHDGSVKAQLGMPDMRLPIQYALGHPERLNGAHSNLELTALRALRFEPPDLDRFPLLWTAMDAGRQGGTAPAVLCGADDAAVDLFLAGALDFGGMTDAVQAVMQSLTPEPLTSPGQALDAFAWGEARARELAARA